MAVTKQTYTITPTWTIPQLANLLKSAFVDAGLMTDWYDSFLSGSVENRILRVQYDATKTYGTTFYWWMFSSSFIFLHVATGWDVINHVPTGTLYLDYFSTTTNATTNHWSMAPVSGTVDIVRYTSNVDTSQSWFVIKSGSSRKVFTIVNASKALQPWMDLSKGFFAGFVSTAATALNNTGSITFTRCPGLRRDLVVGSSLNGETTSSSFTNVATTAILSYGAVGNMSNSFSNNSYIAYNTGGNFSSGNGARCGAIILPTNFSGTNPAFTSNSNPVFHSLPFTPYITSSLPSDFGITFHYATNTFSPGDTFVVTAGVEEWEVLDFAANSSSIVGASPIFLARTI
jgi:hypothetical protein